MLQKMCIAMFGIVCCSSINACHQPVYRAHADVVKQQCKGEGYIIFRSRQKANFGICSSSVEKKNNGPADKTSISNPPFLLKVTYNICTGSVNANKQPRPSQREEMLAFMMARHHRCGRYVKPCYGFYVKSLPQELQQEPQTIYQKIFRLLVHN